MPAVFALAVLIAGIYGYVANIVTLINDANMSMGMVAARAIGIFVAPLGAIFGYI